MNIVQICIMYIWASYHSQETVGKFISTHTYLYPADFRSQLVWKISVVNGLALTVHILVPC